MQEAQGGKGRVAYGEQVLEELSQKLTARYGEGFSKTSLKYFRTFYLARADRVTQIGRPLGDQFSVPPTSMPKGRPMGDLLAALELSLIHISEPTRPY